MNHFTTFLAVCGLLVFGLSGCAPTLPTVCLTELSAVPKKNSTTSRLEHITNLWVGHFSNKKYVENTLSNATADQEYIGRRIWKTERVGEYWLYMAWYPTGLHTKPLAANIAQVTRIAPDTAFITFYKVDREFLEENPYEWTKDEPFSAFRPSDLEGCGVGCGSYIVPGRKGQYIMTNSGSTCNEKLSDVIEGYTIDGVLRPDKIVFNTYLIDDKGQTVVYYPDNTFTRLKKSDLEKRYESYPVAGL